MHYVDLRKPDGRTITLYGNSAVRVRGPVPSPSAVQIRTVPEERDLLFATAIPRAKR